MASDVLIPAVMVSISMLPVTTVTKKMEMAVLLIASYRINTFVWMRLRRGVRDVSLVKIFR